MPRTFKDLPSSADQDFEDKAYDAFQTNIDSVKDLETEITNARQGEVDLNTNLSSITTGGAKVKVNSDDTSEDYLQNKFVAGTNITLELADDGGVETLVVGYDPQEAAAPSSGIVIPPILYGKPYVIEGGEIVILLVNHSDYDTDDNYTIIWESPTLTLDTVGTGIQSTATAPSTNEVINTYIQVSVSHTVKTTSYAVHNIIIFPIAAAADDNIIHSINQIDYTHTKNVMFNMVAGYIEAYKYNSFVNTIDTAQGDGEQSWSDATLMATIENKKPIIIDSNSTREQLTVTTSDKRLFLNDKILLNHKQEKVCHVVQITSITEIDNAPGVNLTPSAIIGDEVEFTLESGSWRDSDIGEYIHGANGGVAKILYYESNVCYAKIIKPFPNTDTLSYNGGWLLSPLIYAINGTNPSLTFIPTIGCFYDNYFQIDSKELNERIFYEEKKLTHVYDANPSTSHTKAGYNTDENIFNGNTKIIAWVNNERTLLNVTSVTRNVYGMTDQLLSISAGTGGLWIATIDAISFPDEAVEGAYIHGINTNAGSAQIIGDVAGHTEQKYVYIWEAFTTTTNIPADQWTIVEYTINVNPQLGEPRISSLAASKYELNLIGETQTTTQIIGYNHFNNFCEIGDTLELLVNNKKVTTTVSNVTVGTKLAYDPHTVLLIRSETNVAPNSISDYALKHTIVNNTQVAHSTNFKKFGNTSLYFDGDNYIKTQSRSELFNFNKEDFTIDFWFNIPDIGTPTSKEYRTFLMFYNTNDNYFIIGHTAENTFNNAIYLCYANDNSNDGYIYEEINNPLHSPGWTHFALVKTKDYIKIYLNGDFVYQLEGINIKFIENPELSIGPGVSFVANSLISSGRYKGYLDEIRISNCARWNKEFLPENYFYTYYKHTIDIPSQTTIPTYCAKSFYNNTKLDINSATVEEVEEEYGFQTLTYEGNGTQIELSINFEPSMVWIKNIDDPSSIYVFDAVRGFDKYIRFNTGQAETTNVINYINYNSNKLYIGNEAAINTLGKNYIAWCWKADLNVLDAVFYEKYSQNLGISIIKYTGALGLNRQLFHNLEKKPKLVIIKNRDTADSAIFYQFKNHLNSLKISKIFTTNLNSSTEGTYVFENDGVCGVFENYITIDNTMNTNAENYIMYMFAEIPDFLQIENFLGNGNIDGPLLNCDFKPELIINTNKGKAFDKNYTDKVLAINSSDSSETKDFSLNNNGLKIKYNDNENTLGTFNSYCAFAEKRPKHYNLTITTEKLFLSSNIKTIACGVTLNENEQVKDLKILVNKENE